MATLIVTDNPAYWQLGSEAEVIPARDYLTGERFTTLRRAKVFNLCRSYGYQSLGYYVSLLAEARGTSRSRRSRPCRTCGWRRSSGPLPGNWKT
jgi:hypothetical protein